MEYKRLTERAENGKPYFDGCLHCDLESDCGLCPYFESGLNRLAELEDKIEQGTLIEQKTCKNINEMHPVDGFTCSECGITIVDYVEEVFDEEEYDTTYHEYEIKYCPNCGAKVVEE